jgi:hypothetical protein
MILIICTVLTGIASQLIPIDVLLLLVPADLVPLLLHTHHLLLLLLLLLTIILLFPVVGTNDNTCSVAAHLLM